MSDSYTPMRTLDGWAYRDDNGTLHTGLSRFQAHLECEFGSVGADLGRLRQWQEASRAKRAEECSVPIPDPGEGGEG